MGRCGPGAKLTLLLLVWAAAACNEDVWALVHPPQDGAESPAPVLPDAQADRALPVDAGADTETDVEGTTLWTGWVEGTGFDAYAGLAVYGRIGSLSREVASSTVDSDGSFVLRFNQAIPIFESSIVYLFFDVTEDGTCNVWEDHVAATSVRFFEFPPEFEVHLHPDTLRPSFTACLGFP